MSEYIQTLIDKYEVKQISITGHSLGGALATLMSLEIVRKFLVIPEIYTFGAPRIGNVKFAEFYN